jgi:hypothetical protein
MNGNPDPFTGINLRLTVNGTPFDLVHADTSLISGTGQFLIDANASTLIFNTANADAQNPADLIFRTASTSDEYIIGSDAIPAFEVAYTSAGDVLTHPTFPVLYGTIVPEPSSLILCGLGVAALLLRRRQ